VTTEDRALNPRVLRELRWDAYLDVKPFRPNDWFGYHAAKHRLVDYAEEFGSLCLGDPQLLAFGLGIKVEFASREKLKSLAHGKDVYGMAWPKEDRFIVAHGLPEAKLRHVVAHELAHVIWPEVCDGKDEGENLADAFAGAWQ
jgi:hypothetical protein